MLRHARWRPCCGFPKPFSATRASNRYLSSTTSAQSQAQPFDETTDLLIVGSGGAGLIAALRAQHHGLRPLIVEKADKVGGATAYSGGSVWVPNNHLQARYGIQDNPEKAMSYLTGLIGDVGEASSTSRRRAFVEHAPKMALFLEQLGFRWRMSEGYPDYHPNLDGGLDKGRSIEGDVFNLRSLGSWRKRMNLNPSYPLPPMFAFEAGKITRALTSLSALALMLKVGMRWTGHRLLGREPVTLGHSLAGQLLRLNLEQQTTILLKTQLVDLIPDAEGSIVGALISKHDEPTRRIRARYGVVLAAGGFAKNAKMRQINHVQPTNPSWSSVPPYDLGDAIQAGTRVNAATALMDDAWWGPSMMVPEDTSTGSASTNKLATPSTTVADPATTPAATQHVQVETGTAAPYFALWDRARPYSIIADSAGNRFTNEAESYVDFVHAQYARHAAVSAIPAYFIADTNFRQRYPIAMIPPRTSAKKAIDAGFLFKGDTLAELADKLGVDKQGLQSTVSRFNEMARKGVDTDYARGSSAYDNFFGDPTNKPNPNLGAISRPPFYAVKIYPGDLGTKGGLLTDEHGRVLDNEGKWIQGLYASGNTTAAVMGRRYAGAGSTLGPALTFAYLAVDDVARRAGKRAEAVVE